MQGLIEKFKAAGFPAVTRTLAEFEDDYGLGYVEGEEDLSDEDEGDGDTEDDDDGEDDDDDDSMSVDKEAR